MNKSIKFDVINDILKDEAQWHNINGILTKEHIGQVSKTEFTEDQQNCLFSIEDKSWWFQYRIKIIIFLIEKFMNENKHIYDIGGGNGFAVKKIMEWISMKPSTNEDPKDKITLIEPSMQACINAAHRDVQSVIHGTLCNEDIKDNCIEQVLLLDVLEHIEQDDDFLKLLYRKVRDKGIVILTVPAHHCLWSSEDESAGHYRRYTKKALCKKVQNAGFTILKQSYFFSFLFIPILLGRVAAEKIGFIKKADSRTEKEKQNIMERQFIKQPAIVKFILQNVQNLECSILKKHTILFGSSIIMVLKK